MIYLYLAVGGAIGTVARYTFGGWVQSLSTSDFPWGTLAVNLVGSMLLGILLRTLMTMSISDELRALLTVGFCGAFTTFSTFSVEAVALLERGEWMRAGSYAAGSVVFGMIAVLIGFQIAGPLSRVAG